MGKLAERLSDPKRSGTYRIEVTDALEEAVALNGFRLERFAPKDFSSVPAHLASCDGRVLLFSGFEPLVRESPGALDALLAQLDAAAGACRQGGQRFFAAFLDPSGLLALPPLYNWKR